MIVRSLFFKRDMKYVLTTNNFVIPHLEETYKVNCYVILGVLTQSIFCYFHLHVYVLHAAIRQYSNRSKLTKADLEIWPQCFLGLNRTS